MSFATLGHTLADQIERAVAAAPADAEEVTVELSVSAERRLAPILRRVSDSTPYADIKVTLRQVDSLEPLRRLLSERWTLATTAEAKEGDTCLR